MKVSIIIPCYNGEATIADAVESALGQTHPDCETIVVDDGSTDDSLSQLGRYAGQITVLSGPRGGGGAARNRGVAAASGTFVQFLDADDLLRPEKVAVCVSAVRELSDQAIPVTDWIRQRLDSDSPNEKYSFPADDEYVLAGALNHALQTAAPLHRWEVLQAIGGFREHLKCCQEKDLHLRLVAAGYRFHRVPFEGVLVRQTAGSVSSSNLKVLLQRREVLSHLSDLLAEKQGVADWRDAVATALTRDAFDLCRSGHFEAARPNLELARRLDPANKGRSGLHAPLPLALSRLLGVHGGAWAYARMRRLARLRA